MRDMTGLLAPLPVLPQCCLYPNLVPTSNSCPESGVQDFVCAHKESHFASSEITHGCVVAVQHATIQTAISSELCTAKGLLVQVREPQLLE